MGDKKNESKAWKRWNNWNAPPSTIHKALHTMRQSILNARLPENGSLFISLVWCESNLKSFIACAASGSVRKKESQTCRNSHTDQKLFGAFRLSVHSLDCSRSVLTESEYCIILHTCTVYKWQTDQQELKKIYKINTENLCERRKQILPMPHTLNSIIN